MAVVHSTTVLQNYCLTARVADSHVGSSYDHAFYMRIRLTRFAGSVD